MSLLLPLYFIGRANFRTEFRRHKTTDNPVHVMGFLLEWKRYLDEIESQYPGGRPFRGKLMDAIAFEKVRCLDIVIACLSILPARLTPLFRA